MAGTSSSFRFQWNGQRIAAALQAAIEDAMQDTADAAVEQARARARVDTGAMRDSIAAEVSPTPEGVQMTLGIGVDYGVYHELGTSRIQARPMIRPAIDAESPKLAMRIRAKVGSIR
jgi:HK97 gp10 family phage protein